MPPSSSGESPSPSTAHAQRPRRWRRPLLGGGLVMLGTMGGLAGWGLHYIQQDLSPTLSQELSRTFERPVMLGPVTSYDLGRVRLGPSHIPPDRRNGDIDADTVDVEAVEVRFNLFQALWSRTLDLDIVLIKPRIYIDQTADGQWLNMVLKPTTGKGWLKTQPRRIQVRNGEVTLDPYLRPSRQLHIRKGTVGLAADQQTLDIDQVQLDSGGAATLKGVWFPADQALQLTATTHQLAIAPLMDWMPELPVQARTAEVTGTFTLDYHPQKVAQLTYRGHLTDLDVAWPDHNIQLKTPKLDADLEATYAPQTKQLTHLVIRKLRSDRFDLRGNRPTVALISTQAAPSGGRVAIQGSWHQPKQSLALGMTLQRVNLQPLTTLIENAPIKLRSVQVTGQLQVNTQRNRPLTVAYRGALTNLDTTLPQSQINVQAQRLRTNITATYSPQTQQLTQLFGTLGSNTLDVWSGAQPLHRSGNPLRVRGHWRQAQQSLVLSASLNRVNLKPLYALVPKPPIELRSAEATGNLKLEYQPEQPLNVSYRGTLANVDTTWPAKPTRVLVKAKRLQTNIDVAYKTGQLPKMTGEINAQGATVGIPETLVLDNERPERLHWQPVKGTLKFRPQPQQRVQFDLAGPLKVGGRLRTQGTAWLALKGRNITWNRLETSVVAQDVPATLLDRAYNLPLHLAQGRVDSDLRVQLEQRLLAGPNAKSKVIPALFGEARIRNVAGQIQGLPQPFSQATGRLSFQGLITNFDQITARYGKIPLKGSGQIDPQRGFDLQAQTALMDVDPVFDTLGITTLPFPVTGRVQGRNIRVSGPIKTPVLTGDMVAQPGITLDRVPFREMTADFRLLAPTLAINNIRAVPNSGGQITGQATYDTRPGGRIRGNLTAANIPGNTTADFYQADPGFPIGPVAGDIELAGVPEDVETRVRFRAPDGTFPTTGLVVIRNRIARLEDVVAQVPGGHLDVTGRIDIARDRIQTDVVLPGLRLAAYDPSLRGQLTGQMRFTGPFSQFSTTTAQGSGQVRFSQGINLIEQPIVAQVGWNGQQLLVHQATAPGFRSDGRIGVDFDDPAGPQLTTLALNVTTQDYDLQHLPPQGPTQIVLVGRANLTGRLSGTVAAPDLDAQLQVKDLNVSRLAFDSPLTGRLRYRTQTGMDLRLRSDRDRIELVLNPEQLPTYFDIQHKTAIARGIPQGDQFAITLVDFPLTALNLHPAKEVGLGILSGRTSGTFTANLDTQFLAGTLNIDQPGLGTLLGQSLAMDLTYRNGLVTIRDGRFAYTNASRYRFNTTINLANHYQTTGTIAIEDTANLADLATAWRIFSLANTPAEAWGNAADIVTTPAGNPNATLWSQLQQLAKLQFFQKNTPPPSPLASRTDILEGLTGLYSGQIDFAGSLTSGFSGTFALATPSLGWQAIQGLNIVAQGRWTQDDIPLEDLTLIVAQRSTPPSAQADASNPLAIADLKPGTLKLIDVELQPLSPLFDLPYNVTGALSADIRLLGDRTTPQLTGQLALAYATINNTSLRQTNTKFKYEQGLLSFSDGEIILNFVEAAPPVEFQGDIPYPWPFADAPAQPTGPLDLTLEVKDRGLALLVNSLNAGIDWQQGQGTLSVNVAGALNQPDITGKLTIDQATLKASALPQDLNNVRGQICFGKGFLVIDQQNYLQGYYGDTEDEQPHIEIKGMLPIFTDSPLALNTPITDCQMATGKQLDIRLRNLDKFTLKGLYRGAVEGDLSITGTAIEPAVGGRVILSDGQILIPESTADTGPTLPVVGGSVTNDATDNPPLRWNKLTVSLADNVQIAQPPLFSFVATGDISLYGDANTPRPLGGLTIQKGSVNLLTSRFRLDPRQSNFVCFGNRRTRQDEPTQAKRDPAACLLADLSETNDWEPQIGLDPYLNVSMVTRVTDSVAARLSKLNDEAAIQSSAVGNVESVRIRAKAEGRASTLSQDFSRVVELSSSPNRTRNETLALLGAGVSDQLQDGDTQLALVNLASSAALTGIGGLFDDALAPRGSFRVFPVLIPTTENNASDRRSVLEFGAELGFDITDKLSVSALQIVSDLDQPTLLNVSYDINEQFRARAAVSVDGEGVGILEYRIRF